MSTGGMTILGLKISWKTFYAEAEHALHLQHRLIRWATQYALAALPSHLRPKLWHCLLHSDLADFLYTGPVYIHIYAHIPTYSLGYLHSIMHMNAHTCPSLCPKLWHCLLQSRLADFLHTETRLYAIMHILTGTIPYMTVANLRTVFMEKSFCLVCGDIWDLTQEIYI